MQQIVASFFHEECSRIPDEWIILIQCGSFSIIRHLKMTI
jgi:hypothetical protein